MAGLSVDTYKNAYANNIFFFKGRWSEFKTQIKAKENEKLWLKRPHKLGGNPSITFGCGHCFETVGMRTETARLIKHASWKVGISQWNSVW
jgi:hypothetical protein